MGEVGSGGWLERMFAWLPDPEVSVACAAENGISERRLTYLPPGSNAVRVLANPGHKGWLSYCCGVG
jgi:hypothetical protein